MDDFDIIMETTEGNHLLMASSSNRQYAAIVAESIYYHSQATQQPGRSQARSVIVRTGGEIMDVWPEHWKDFDAWQAAMDRAKSLNWLRSQEKQ